jgi:DNA-binding transcriptional LysR family regulator
MTHALDAAGRRWPMAYFSDSQPSLEAAVEQGLGVSLLPRRLVGSGHRLLDGMAGFAPVPDVEVALHVRAQLSAPGRRLAEGLCEVCGTLLGVS